MLCTAACALDHVSPVTTPDEVDLSTYPSRSAASVSAEAFATTSTELVEVPGASLSVLTQMGETWIVLLSAQIGSSVTRQPSPNFVDYTIDGVERGIGTAQSGVADSLGPWQHLDWFIGDGSVVSVRMQLRSGSGDATASIDSASIVAFRLPAGSDVTTASADNAQLVTNTDYQAVTSLTFTPPAAGDYLIFGVANAQESPGQSDIFVRWRTPTGALWNDYLQNPRGGMQSFFVARRISLDAVPQTFTTEALGSSTGAGSTVQFARLLAVRTDAFDAVFSSAADNVNTGTHNTVTVTEVSSEATESARPHIVVQSLGAVYACGSTDERQLAPAFAVNGVATSSFVYSPGSCVYRPTFGDVRLVTTAEPITATVSLSATTASNTARDATSHILRLRF